VNIYECFDGDRAEIIEKKLATQREFEQALTSYHGKDFAKSLEAIKYVLRENPGDGTAKLYRQKLEYYLEAGIEDDWTGVETMLTK